MLEVVNQSSGASFVFEKNVPKYMMTGNYDQPGFKLGLMKKDVGLYIDTVKEMVQLSNLDPRSLVEVETNLSEYLLTMKPKFVNKDEKTSN